MKISKALGIGTLFVLLATSIYLTVIIPASIKLVTVLACVFCIMGIVDIWQHD